MNTFPMKHEREDLTGQRFGSRVAIEFVRKGGRNCWLTRCDCGDERVVRADNIKKHHRCVSCRYEAMRIDPSQGAFNNILSKYKHGAKSRGYAFELTEQGFLAITQQDCHYCGVEPLQGEWYRGNGVYIYNGIDRKDNSLGYVAGNCLPCCGTCNQAKSSMNYDQFISWIDRVHRRVAGRQG